MKLVLVPKFDLPCAKAMSTHRTITEVVLPRGQRVHVAICQDVAEAAGWRPGARHKQNVDDTWEAVTFRMLYSEYMRPRSETMPTFENCTFLGCVQKTIDILQRADILYVCGGYPNDELMSCFEQDSPRRCLVDIVRWRVQNHRMLYMGTCYGAKIAAKPGFDLLNGVDIQYHPGVNTNMLPMVPDVVQFSGQVGVAVSIYQSRIHALCFPSVNNKGRLWSWADRNSESLVSLFGPRTLPPIASDSEPYNACEAGRGAGDARSVTSSFVVDVQRSNAMDKTGLQLRATRGGFQVGGVVEGGLVDMWNKSVEETYPAAKVMVDDVIVGVNAARANPRNACHRAACDALRHELETAMDLLILVSCSRSSLEMLD